jgi:transposase
MVYLRDMRPQGTPQQLHKRRKQAIKLLQAGKIPASVARAVSASRSSVTRWWQVFKRDGWTGLRAQPIPGRPPRLSAKQKHQLERDLLKGPLAAGYQTDLWTLRRVTRLIKKRFRISYHPGHVWKILGALGWSCQKPERRATQRDEAAIAHWKRYVWPQIRYKADRLGAHLIFLDESGFLLIPNVKRTWAPVGRTPMIRYCFKHQKLSAISALAVSPKRKHLALYLQFRRRSFKGPDVKRFLQDLLKHVRGPIVLLWDSGRIHRHHEVTAWCQSHPRLHVEEFPGYAPELNPAEYVWCQSDSALANSVPEELDELKTMLVATKRRLLRSQDLLWSCIYASDLPWK